MGFGQAAGGGFLEGLGQMLGQLGMGQITRKNEESDAWSKARMGVGIDPTTGKQDPEFMKAAQGFYGAKGYSPIEQALMEKLGGALGGIGGGMPGGAQGSPQASADTTAPVDEDQAALQWAKQNPQDPRAQAIMQKLGM